MIYINSLKGMATPVRPKVPPPELFDGKPYEVHAWMFLFKLCFAAFKLNCGNADAKNCCKTMALLFYGRILQWFRISMQCNRGALATKYTDLKRALLT